MAFNLFGPPTKDDIRVGYIDPDLGLVEGVTICQANEYAIKNPGTTFVFRNGNNVIQYLNVNEVNQLDPNILTSTDECGGINQRKECGPPTIQLFGGGGVGAAGNPVVGRDGALLAVDIVRGGNGYQYPPLVAARDNCNYGSGATLTAVLGEVTETIETYENESDFEDYELCEPTDVGYGRRYGPDGEDLGPWEPRLYTDPGQDPIRREVDEFQEIVRRLGRKPFFSSLKNRPTNIFCSDSKVLPQVYDVRTKWGPESFNPNEFMSSYAISPVPPSNVRGSDFAGRLFTFEWTEDFPTDGEYVFRMLCDNVADLYVDNLKITSLKNMWGSTSKGGAVEPVIPVQKTIKKGIHKIRVDLLNLPFYENVTSALGSSGKSNQTNIEVKKVFNTKDFIDKSNRTLWRNDPSLHAGKTLLNLYGITPFDPSSEAAKTQSFAGIHPIVWNNINFPVDGFYKIRMAVDDNVTLRIGDTQIKYRGFINPPVPNKEFDEFKFFKAGNYTIRAELEQIAGKPIANGNPMALAIDIQIATETETVISPKSWQENAMAVALVIDAPDPPIPQEPKPQQEGRCPSNPIWSTRFPGAKEQWYPVRYSEALRANGITEWSDFLNRYAISPVKPLDIPGSDAGGILFTNTWDIDIPYDGFYKFAVQRDETARIFVDGKLAFDVTTAGDDIWRDFRNKPKFQKVFITKGRHIIGIELENRVTETFDQVNQLIFRTADWQVSPVSNTIDITFDISGGSDSVNTINIKDLFTGSNRNRGTKGVSVEIGKVYEVSITSTTQKFIRLRATGGKLEVEDFKDGDFNDLVCLASRGVFYDIQGSKCKFIVEKSVANNSGLVVSGTQRNGVTYEGPTLIAHKDNRWGQFMNFQSVSPIVPGNPPDSNGRKKFTWKGVKFPESGQYDIRFLADNDAKLFIGGKEVLRAQGFAENPQVFKVNVTQGTYDIIVDSEYPYTTSETNTKKYFSEENPTGFGLAIRKNVTIRKDYGKSWIENPIAISAILIPPPCPRRIRGRGVVTDVIVNDPGNGYLRPIPQDQGYPVALRLKEVIVENPGINYNCGVDELRITPSNGAELEYICDPFGKIREVKVLNPGLGFTEYPEIRLISETGVNASFRPVFEVVRDPIILPERLIQVTDLVGLKQTGYVDGRAYYGAVYYDQGVRYAGFYETVGDLVQVYDTLQESITAQVTTPASAIQRQGTDVTSNDPRLNIPRTPENLI
jgi:hypothetical protein